MFKIRSRIYSEISSRLKSLVIASAVYLFLISGFLSSGRCQGVDRPSSEVITIDAIMDSLVHQHNKVEDYQVKVKISVKMPRFRMPNKKVKLYYKQPNKVKVKASGFAVVPKTGLTLSPTEIIDNLFDTQVAGLETHDDHSFWVMEGVLHPDSMKFNIWDNESEDESVVKMRLWIDRESWVISRAETRIDTVTVMSVHSTYQQFEGDIWMPQKTELSFFLPGKYLENIGAHEPMGGPFRAKRKIVDKDENGDFQGSVRMEYSKYKINKGLPDRIFRESDY